MPQQLSFKAPGYTTYAVVLNGQLYASIPRTIDEVGGTAGSEYRLSLRNVMVPCTWAELVAARPNAPGRNVLRIDGNLYFENAMRLSEDGTTILRGGILGRTRNRMSMGPGWFNEDGSWHFEPASATAEFDALGVVAPAGAVQAWTDSAMRSSNGVQTVEECYDSITRHYIDGGGYPPYPDAERQCEFFGAAWTANGSNDAFRGQRIFTTARLPFMDMYGSGFSWNTGPVNILCASARNAVAFERK